LALHQINKILNNNSFTTTSGKYPILAVALPKQVSVHFFSIQQKQHKNLKRNTKILKILYIVAKHKTPILLERVS